MTRHDLGHTRPEAAERKTGKMARIEGLLFDMDGLLLDTERLSKHAYETASRHFGITPENAVFESLIGRNATANARTLAGWLNGAVELSDFEAVWLETYQGAMAQGIPLRPGVADVLAALDGKLPMAVATSSKRATAETKLDSTGLRRHFDALIAGDEVTESKPAPEIFERAAELIGLAPAVCAAFEDSVNGVRSAAAAGCVVVQVPDLVPATEETRTLAHAIAPSLRGAMEVLDLL